jgi:sugar lactone lactonase YvrE
VEPEVAVDMPAIVGEGPIWDADEQVLYWVDILSALVCIYNPQSGKNRTIDVGQVVGTVVPRASSGLMLALHNGFSALDLQTEKLTPIADPERKIPGNRFNDGKCDPAGRFWAGTMEFDGKPDQGALYCLELDQSVSQKVSPVTISNGIVWSHDARTMYYIDSGSNNVRVWDYDIDTGDIKNERVVDGMTIDEEGKLWIAVPFDSSVRRYDPNNGALLESLRLPVSLPSACAFGGPDLDNLYITSIRPGQGKEPWDHEPLAGSLLRVKMDVRGVPAFKYDG